MSDGLHVFLDVSDSGPELDIDQKPKWSNRGSLFPLVVNCIQRYSTIPHKFTHTIRCSHSLIHTYDKCLQTHTFCYCSVTWQESHEVDSIVLLHFFSLYFLFNNKCSDTNLLALYKTLFGTHLHQPCNLKLWKKLLPQSASKYTSLHLKVNTTLK